MAVVVFVSMSCIARLIFAAKGYASLSPVVELLDLDGRFLRHLTLFTAILSSLVYLMVWLIGTAYLVCGAIVIKESGTYSRMLELTGLSFYSQIPFGVAMLIIALCFSAPKFSVLPDTSVGDLGQVLIRHSEAIQSSAAYVGVAVLGLVSHAWLMGLYVCALRVHAQVTWLQAVALGAPFYVVVFVVTS